MKKKFFAVLVLLCMIINTIILPQGMIALADNDPLEPQELYYTIFGERTDKDNADITLSKKAEWIGYVGGSSDKGRYEITLSAQIDEKVNPVHTNVVFVLDASGSMKYCADVNHASQHHQGNWCGGTENSPSDRWTMAKQAIANTVSGFDESVASKFVKFSKNNTKSGNDQSIYDGGPDEGTYLTKGVETGLGLFDTFEHKDSCKKVMIIVGDGDSDDGYPTTQANNFKNNGGEIYVLGIGFGGGTSTNENAFRSLATDADHFFYTENEAAFYEKMASISKNINGMVSDYMGDNLVMADKNLGITYVPVENEEEQEPIVKVKDKSFDISYKDGVHGNIEIVYRIDVDYGMLANSFGQKDIKLNTVAQFNYLYGDATHNQKQYILDFPVPMEQVYAASLVCRYYSGATRVGDEECVDWIEFRKSDPAKFNFNRVPQIGTKKTIGGKDYYVKNFYAIDESGTRIDMPLDIDAATGSTKHLLKVELADDTNNYPVNYEEYTGKLPLDYAKQDVKEAKYVKLVLNDGKYEGNETVDPIKVDHEVTLSTPTKDGYVFMGWEKEAASEEEYYNDDIEYIFTAEWEKDEIGKDDQPYEGDGIPDKYQATITFELEGGIWSESEQNSDPKYLVVTILDEENNYAEEGSATVNMPVGMVASDMHEETGAWDVEVVDDKTEIKKAGEYTYTYTFDDMYNVNYTAYAEGQQPIPNQSDTVSYNTVIKVNPQGGDWEYGGTPYESYSEDIEITVTDTVDLPDPQKEEYIFMGWESNDNVYNAQWEKDIIGEGDDPEEGDEIPDKFQAKVIFKMNVGGTWDGTPGNDKDIVKVVTFVNEDNKWVATGEVEIPVPADMKPIDNYTDQGSWDSEIGETITVTEAKEYVYTYSFEQKWKVDYKKFNDGQKPEDSFEMFPNNEQLIINPNGGTWKDSPKISIIYVTDNMQIEDAKYEGHVFMGWDVEGNVYTAQWEKDEIGKDGKTEEGDEIPDKYQATVTFKIVNGTWLSTQDDLDRSYVVTFTDEDDKWTTTGSQFVPVPADDMKPNENCSETGEWNEDLGESVEVTEAREEPYVYTYSYNNMGSVTYKKPVDDDIPVSDKKEYVLESKIVVDPNNGLWRGTSEKTELIVDGDIELEDPTYTDNIFMGWEVTGNVYKAIWEEDVIGKDNKGDKVPDKYQAIVIFKVKNGIWQSLGNANDRTQIVTFFGDTSKWATSGSVKVAVPDDMKNNEGYVSDGSWSEVLGNEVEITEASKTPYEYIYTFIPERLVKYYKPVPGKNPERSNNKVADKTKIYVNPKGGDWEYDGNKYEKQTRDIEIIVTSDIILENPVKADNVFMGWDVNGNRYEAIWLEDKMGGGDDYKESDEIPDIYQKKLTFEIQNGSWQSGSKNPITAVLTLFDDEGKWSNEGKANYDKLPFAGMVNDYGYAETGTWSESEPQNPFIGNNAETYILNFKALDKPEITYKKQIPGTRGTPNAKYTAGSYGERIIVDPNGGQWEYSGDVYTEATTFPVEADMFLDGEGNPVREDYLFMGWEILDGYGDAERLFKAIWELDVEGNTADGIGPDKIPDRYQRKITFNITNGYWHDTDNNEIVKYVELIEGGIWSDTGKGVLKQTDIPDVSNAIPFETYGRPSWNKPIQTVVEENADYEYSYICVLVEYKIEHMQQDANGETYSVADTESPLYAIDGTDVRIESFKEYDNFELNTALDTEYSKKLEYSELPNVGVTVLRAYYDRKTYTVSYDLDGISDTSGNDYTTADRALYGTTIKTKAAPESNSYNFDYWTDGENIYKADSNLVVDGDKVLKAVWSKKSSGSSSGGGGRPGTVKPQIKFETNGGSKINDVYVTYNTPVSEPKAPVKDGYILNGWYKDKTLKTLYDFDTPVKTNITLYASWVADPDRTGVSDVLNTKEHIKYLDGYETGDFRPHGNMTRAEVARMFYNLLTNKNVSGNAHFDDVDANAWYADAVITLANMGILKGVGNNMYYPDAPVTKAEFAAIAVRYTSEKSETTISFADVPADHWAAKDISTAASFGWVRGDDNGNFNPDINIERAQVTKIVNFMLGRSADLDYVKQHHSELRFFPDVHESDWYYGEVVEATNAHDYVKENGREIWK